MSARETPASPVIKTGSHDRAIGDDALSQAMLRVLERVARATPNVAEYWLEATERIMDDLDCTMEQKLKGAVSLLRDETYQWWLTVREGTQADRLTWDFFKTSFQGKYVGASYVDARMKEFLNLTQGNRTVAAYEAEFLQLSRYARGIVMTEYKRYMHFEDGLRNELRIFIAPQRERDFTALVEKTKITEDVKRSECQNREKDRGRGKRDFGSSGSAGRPIKRAKFDGPVRVGDPDVVARPQPCVDCGRSHLGECWKKIGACFRCRSINDQVRNCPQRPTQIQAIGQGHVQPVRGGQPLRGRGQAKGGNGFGQGRGAPGRGTCNTEARQPALVYAARHREDGDAPDIITGMDWLVKHRAKLDCAAKLLVLKTSEDEEVAIIGERRDYLSNVISTLRAEKLVRKGCEAFLAYVSHSEAKSLSVEDVRTVKEFPDVFLEELSSLPPDRKVEFDIELLPGTAPQKSFEKLKKALTEASVLIQLKSRKEFTVYSKANVVADTLSRKVVSDLTAMFARLSLYDDGSLLAELQVRPTWTVQIKEKKLLDESLVPRFQQVGNGETLDFGLNGKGVLCFRGRVCIPNDSSLRQFILREAHGSPYAMHPGGNKLY
ncbi:uncharacterized protein [Gossypium hirsutum]|uniref:Retrotransposon gag domain-containing protein n=1 Tax=Gossypium hirsutum TaxID=3635 RepID=A0ABM2YK78_GOSHI|nr:uncharacterized protein LOC121203662 [Gossypium hirsutum]